MSTLRPPQCPNPELFWLLGAGPRDSSLALFEPVILAKGIQKKFLIVTDPAKTWHKP